MPGGKEHERKRDDERTNEYGTGKLGESCSSQERMCFQG